ncbi:uncharacterized protein TNCV_1104271 [Trichonephila clavipes]|nr:uncharacterized protein TNCV_1104271 [Trichonephila clavipes]
MSSNPVPLKSRHADRVIARPKRPPVGVSRLSRKFWVLLYMPFFFNEREECGSPVVKVSDQVRHVMSSSSVPLKTHRVGQRCTLNLSRAETFSRWCGVVIRKGGASSGVVHVT